MTNECTFPLTIIDNIFSLTVLILLYMTVFLFFLFLSFFVFKNVKCNVKTAGLSISRAVLARAQYLGQARIVQVQCCKLLITLAMQNQRDCGPSRGANV